MTVARNRLVLTIHIGNINYVRKIPLNAHYQSWCKCDKYNFSKLKTEEIYGNVKELVSALPKDKLTKFIIEQAVKQLNIASATA